ncbi:hypothetical protein MGSAQ_000669, partial [marine sediment metagenome]
LGFTTEEEHTVSVAIVWRSAISAYSEVYGKTPCTAYIR